MSVTIAEIQRAVAEHFHIPLIEMTSERREAARPRQIAMYLARELTPRSLPVIAREFGKYDPTNVKYAIRKVEALVAADPQLGMAIQLLRAQLADPDQPLLPLAAE